jgi:hypothetical protein
MDLATSLERAILKESGQRLGPWVRVRSTDAEATAVTTARLAIVAAGVGDPLAADLAAFVDANPPRETLVVLERALTARSIAERMPGTEATATLTVDGTTRSLTIDPMHPTWLRFTPRQMASARLTRGTGTVIVASRWEAPLDPSSFHQSLVINLARRVTPKGPIAIDALVDVVITANVGDAARRGQCWLVSDYVPSGLVPIAAGRVDSEEDEATPDPNVITPWRIEGQRVDFCAEPYGDGVAKEMHYVARVVSPGTYRWESAVIQSSIVPEDGAVVAPMTVRIGPM